MGKLVEATHVALCGEIGAPHEWGLPYMNDEQLGYVTNLLTEADALLLGRVTYEGLSAAYPQMKGDWADRMNSIPKYVASTTLRETTWNATLIKGDVVDGVSSLKAAGHSLLKFGTGPLDRVLMDHNLVDEFHFWLNPVAVGNGQRLFEDIEATTHLKLVATTTFSTGVVALTYTPL